MTTDGLASRNRCKMTNTFDLQEDLAGMMYHEEKYPDGFFSNIIDEYTDLLIEQDESLPTNVREIANPFALSGVQIVYDLVPAKEITDE